MSKKINIKPLGARVVIEQKPQEKEQVVSGIILPESDSSEVKNTGEVVAVGDKVKDLSVGDIVFYAQYGGDNITIDDNQYSILKEESVLAILK